MASTTEPILRDERFPQRPLNGCGGCHADFTSLRLFDAHRVGTYAYNWSPDREDGRRCLSPEEMAERGWTQDEKGRWFDPERVEDARRRLSRVAEAQTAEPGVEDEEEAA